MKGCHNTQAILYCVIFPIKYQNPLILDSLLYSNTSQVSWVAEGRQHSAGDNGWYINHILYIIYILHISPNWQQISIQYKHMNIVPLHTLLYGCLSHTPYSKAQTKREYDSQWIVYGLSQSLPKQILYYLLGIDVCLKGNQKIKKENNKGINLHFWGTWFKMECCLADFIRNKHQWLTELLIAFAYPHT